MNKFYILKCLLDKHTDRQTGAPRDRHDPPKCLALMCNNVNVFVYVIDSTYSNERKMTWLGKETFNVLVDEREYET